VSGGERGICLPGALTERVEDCHGLLAVAHLAAMRSRRQTMNKSDLHSTGLDTRRDVLGHDYVEAGLAGSETS
jgi:hypothetical protein